MKKNSYIVGLLSLWMVTSVSAQSVKKLEATMEDYLPLLNAAGYQVYSFDISEFVNESYLFTFKVKEYSDSIKGRDVGSAYSIPNRMMINEFPEESQKSIIAEGKAFDAEKGVYMQGDKMYIGFRPEKTDSMKFVHLGIKGIGERSVPVELKGLKMPGKEKKLYFYSTLPFKLEKFEEGTFIPLVFFGSGWLDEKFGFLRFCGADEIGPDMKADYIENTPHYYAIGVEFKKR